jgi:nifR3 family TIM-barrel protein
LPGLTLPGNIFLAPLAGYTDRAFREICLRFGASFTYTEMVSAEAVARNSKKTLSLLERGPDETLLGIQIFLAEEDQAVRALPRLLEFSPSLLDINCGCPVPKVTRSGAGAALMRDPKRVYSIVKALTDRTNVPITVKIRSGWDQSELNYLEVAQRAIDAGASMIGLHARTKAQGYAGRSDWSHIRRLTEKTKVPVIGSGDLFTAEDALRMMGETGCAGVMFARGAIGNPVIFEKTRALLAGERLPSSDHSEPTETEDRFRRLRIGMAHLERCIFFKGEGLGCKEMKKHLSAYTRGLPEASTLRNDLMKCETVDDYDRVLTRYLELHSLTGDEADETGQPLE